MLSRIWIPVSLITLASILIGASTNFRDPVRIGVTSSTAVTSSAILEVISTTKGQLPPKWTTTQRDAISSPVSGLSGFNTTTSAPNFYSGSAWTQVATTADANPVGAVIAFAGTSAPTGYLLCDGTAVSRSTYATLFALIGVTHGQGDNSTTFNVPDYRGRFLRGRDGAVGRDPNAGTRTAMNTGGNTGDNVGSVQLDAFQGHYHTLTNGTNIATYQLANVWSALAGNNGGGPVTATVTAAITDGSNGTPRTAAESRPLNANVNWIIKY